jgi:membrane-bound inhibitor of C-type lysozyme
MTERHTVESAIASRKTMCRYRTAAMLMVPAVILSGCVPMVTQEPWDPQGRYVCEDGKAFTVALSQDGGSAIIAHENQRLVLPVAGGATDAKYSDGRSTLYLDGPRALLDIGGQVFARGCVKR